VENLPPREPLDCSAENCRSLSQHACCGKVLCGRCYVDHQKKCHPAAWEKEVQRRISADLLLWVDDSPERRRKEGTARTIGVVVGILSALFAFSLSAPVDLPGSLVISVVGGLVFGGVAWGVASPEKRSMGAWRRRSWGAAALGFKGAGSDLSFFCPNFLILSAG
jgi:hypothetical protein